MNDKLNARDFVVDFLRKELVGPSPGYPVAQIDGQEILRPQDPPRKRYAAGILFPIRSQVAQQEETESNEDSSIDAESPDDMDRIIEGTKDGSVDQSQTNSDDTNGETDVEIALANQFLPSAMGLSAVVNVPDCLVIEVSAAVYRHEPLQSERQTKQGVGVHAKFWWRTPIDRSVEISSSELLGTNTKSFEKVVFDDNGLPALGLHIVSRPHQNSAELQNARLVTFTLINRRVSGNKTPENSSCFFQCAFSVREPNGKPCFIKYPERYGDGDDLEEKSLRLLYLHHGTFAVGHGCASEWIKAGDEHATLIRTEVLPTYEIKPILPTQIPGLNLRMTDLIDDDMNSSIKLYHTLADEYEAWIIEKEAEIASRPNISPEIDQELNETARRHMENCRECLRRMREGLILLERDSNSALAFRLMNEAMFKQSVHYKISTDHVRNWKKNGGRLELEQPFYQPNYNDPKWERYWYPFQLAFILMNLTSIAEPECPERKSVDVIWFPTGGGKTEAYLGLSAFCMFLRRLRNPSHAGTSILMRYTLRLLTTQQFQRAASLICACEIIRRKQSDLLGSEPFSIGLWVGGEVTPNTEKAAVDAFNNIRSTHGANKFVLLSCPWCGAAMGRQQDGNRPIIKGYRRLPRPNRVRHICEDLNCDFNSAAQQIPVAVIDEHIYSSPPTLVIGTVDKFAMLAFQPRARYLFGIDTLYPPPELIVQDELHLISGPLGSMVGHYETAVDALCNREYNGNQIPAKIIASTATITRAENQVKGLYGKQAFLFPPQALKAGDSFFAKESEDKTGRLYLGVFGSALTSHVTAQVRTIAALLQAPKLIEAKEPELIDPYWTVMGYFNSLRELGHAATLIRADIREYLNAMWDRIGFRFDMKESGVLDHRRFINKDVELTSRVQSSEIPDILRQLFHRYDGSLSPEAVDVCFATNMIQVGLDIPRLSLMTIIGQPKTTAEYIQASSRIGRDIKRPGLVVVNYNPFKPRDRSHYEQFRSYHHAIYQNVEPASVTAFSAPVCDRALHALIIILCRFWGDKSLCDGPDDPPNPELVNRIKITIRSRVETIDPNEWMRIDKLIDEIIRKWTVSPPSRYGGFGRIEEEMPLMYPAGSPQHPHWLKWPFPTPTSMRNVDAECAARLLSRGYDASAEF